MGPEPGVMSDMTFRISSMVILSAGTLFAMWIGERITDGGIGNGISILIRSESWQSCQELLYVSSHDY